MKAAGISFCGASIYVYNFWRDALKNDAVLEDGDLSALMLFCKSSFTAGHLEDIVQKSVTDLIRCLGSVSDGAGIEVDQAAALFIEESGVGGDLYCGSGNSESFD